MGHYFGDKQARTWIKFRKKTIRTITYNNYTAHTEPLLKELNLLKVKDMFDLKILKFLFKLYHNELSPYFNIYRVHLEKKYSSLYFASTCSTSSRCGTCI